MMMAKAIIDVTVRVIFLIQLKLMTQTRSVWSNFEIADMDFWRGEAYSRFFDHLDRAGGFYYEVIAVLQNL